MIVKRSRGDRIITKKGKVSCSCCDESVCCMYPADAFGTDADLPDTINFNGTTLSKNGSNYGNTTFGVILEGSSWVRYIGGEAVSSSSCLIKQDLDSSVCNIYSVRDNFGSTYYFDSSDLPSSQVGTCPGGEWSNYITRGKYTGFEGQNPDNYFDQRCCAWGSPYSNCQPWPTVIQESNALLFFNGIDFFDNGNDVNKWIVTIGVYGVFGIKTGNQNSPIGTYPAYTYEFGVQGEFIGNIVIS